MTVFALVGTLYNISLRSVYQIGRGDLPRNLVRAADERDLPLVRPENWMFVHHRGEIPEEGDFEEDVLYGRDTYTGCLHVDSDGILRSQVSDREEEINTVSREDLVEWAV